MCRISALGLWSVITCGSAATQLLACDETAGADVPQLAQLDADGCFSVAAGTGFASLEVGPTSTLGVLDLTAMVSAVETDGVIGLARTPASRFDQLATAVRFSPGGVLDARDGAAYRADEALPFELGRAYPIRVVADVGSHTYSVYVKTSSDPSDVVRLANRFAFRPTQAGVTGLGALSAIADGPAGALSVCGVVGTAGTDVAYSREGSYTVAPLPGGEVIASDGISSTLKLDAAGRVIGEAACGGEVAADEAGNVYVALAANGQLSVRAYTAALVPRWIRVEAAPSSATVRGIAADMSGVSIVLGTEGAVSSIRRFPAAGGSGVQVAAGGGLAALARDGFAIATMWDGGFGVTLYDRDGGFQWTRTFDGAASIEVLTLGQDGRVVVGGHFYDEVGFGGPMLHPTFGEVDVDSYALGLARADGAHVFTTRIATSRLTGAAGAGGRLVIVGETWVTPIFPHLWQLDAAGHFVGFEPETGFYEQWGRSGSVVLGADGRIYWQRSMVWPSPVSPAFPYLLALRGAP
jgi:hypothetical protein